MKKQKNKIIQKQQNFELKLVAFLLAIFLIKVAITFNINGAWLGADGENYLEGANSILKDGLFSNNGKLLFWPAGYPLLIVLFAKLKMSWTLYILSLFQSGIFSYSLYLFGNELYKTKLNKIAGISVFFIAINPTLSLSSNVIGYESLTASGYLLLVSIILNDLRTKNELKMTKKVALSSAILSMMTFMQPRLILSLLVIIIWIFVRAPKKTAIYLSTGAIAITSILPGMLVLRNVKANNIATISNNLGYTLNIGAGSNATGGYTNDAKGVPCPSGSSDGQLAVCVLKWNTNNPIKAVKLVFNRTIYFWSPWDGPVANGTMARNPWLKIDPFKTLFERSSISRIYWGFFGKLIGWLFVLGQVILLFFGFNWIKKLGVDEKRIAQISLIIVMSSWFISALTIGDHRFRIPIMGISIFLQMAGLHSIRQRIYTRKGKVI